MAPDAAADPPRDEWQSQHSATFPDWHTHHYNGQTLTHTHGDGRQRHGYYGHAEDPPAEGMRAIEHRRGELKFRRRVWHEAGTALERAARLLLVAVVRQRAPEIMRITLTGEYCEEGDLRLSITSAQADLKGVLGDEDLLVFVDTIEETDGINDALLDMVAGSGEDYLGEHTIDITEEGKYA